MESEEAMGDLPDWGWEEVAEVG
uniref:Uncharacterized protein n=1 Tax=Arundo donax TaxID=35708 RepID=A0A0A9PPE0_ARUDO